MTMEVLGDRWSLVVLRDLTFGPNRRFRELLRDNIEGIASNILADRLAKLVAAGLLTRNPVAGHKQRIDYRLTEPAIQLVPVFAYIGAWGARWLPTTPELRVRAELLDEGGPSMWTEFMNELRAEHVDGQPRAAHGVLDRLTQAYEERKGE